jgi:hypothetical protein
MFAAASSSLIRSHRNATCSSLIIPAVSHATPPGGLMPEFTFCGTTPCSFPETRDAHAVIIGFVNPGDEREFTGPFGVMVPEDPDEAAAWFPAPTADWFPSGGPLPKRLPDPEPEDSGEDSGGAEADAKPAPVPAPAPRAKSPAPASVTPPEGGSESDD